MRLGENNVRMIKEAMSAGPRFNLTCNVIELISKPDILCGQVVLDDLEEKFFKIA